MTSRRFLILPVCIPVVMAVLNGCQRAPLTAMERAQASYVTGNWNDTIATCNEVLAENPDDCEALKLRGRAYLAMQRFDESIADFSSLLKLQSSDHEVYYYRSRAYKGLGDDQRADTDRAKARELDPQRESSYAYSPSNFLPKSAATDSARRPEQPRRETSPAAEDTSDGGNDSSLVGGDDFPSQPPEIAAPRPAFNSRGHDAEYVRDAVDDFRRMISETESMIGSADDKSPAAARRVRSKLPDLAIDPGKLVPEGAPDRAEAAGDKPVAPEPVPTRTSDVPALSTAIPPGFAPIGGNAPVPSPYATTAQPGRLGPVSSAPSAPQAGYVPLPGQVPVPYGLPAVSASGGRTMMQPNPIHAPGAKPVLSTSLPAGSQLLAPGLGPPPAAAPSAFGSLPPMLPPPVRRSELP